MQFTPLNNFIQRTKTETSLVQNKSIELKKEEKEYNKNFNIITKIQWIYYNDGNKRPENEN